MTMKYIDQYVLNENTVFPDTILNRYKILVFEYPHIWLVLILAILGQLRV